MKKFLLFLTLFLSAVGIAQAAEVTLPASGKTWASYTWTTSDKKNYTCNNLEGYTFILKGNSNTGKEPDATDMRIYAGGKLTITAPDGIKFTKISVTIAGGGAATGATTSETSTWTTSGTFSTKEGSTFSIVATTGQSSITFWGVQGTKSTTKKMFIKSVTITTEDEKDCGIAFTSASGAVTYGETFTLPFQNEKKVAVTFSSDNEDVAAVDANTGAVTIKGIGTANIKASFAGNTTYDAKEVTFTLTVKKAKIAYLVTDASTLKVDDIIIIANQEFGKAISTETKSDNRAATSVSFNDDKSEIVSIGSNVMLFKLKQWTDSDGTFWMLETTNYTDKAGSLYCGLSSSSSSTLKIGTPDNNYYDAVITIDQETGVANIAFNKGSDTGNNLVRYNSTWDLFNCYSSTNTQKSVYIYKVTDEPETVETQVCGGSFAEANSSLDVKLKFKTSTTANQVAIFMNDVMVGTFNVNVSDGKVDATINNAPYLTDAKFTMRPVLKSVGGVPTQLGPSEALEVTWPTLPTFVVNAKTPKWYYQESKFYTEAGNTYADLDLWIYMTPSVSTTLSYTFAEFDNSVAGTEIWGWYDENKEQLQNCKYKFLTKVLVDNGTNKPVVSEELLKGKEATATFTPVFLFNVDNKYSSLISGSTRAAAPALLGEEAPILVQEVNGTKITESIEISALSGAEVSGVESVVVEDVDGAVEYYNMQGVRVEGELAPGMYIRRQGRSVSKVQIR